MTIVAKFGGSSLADSGCIRRAADIIRSDRDRKYIVVSAPGKRNPSDNKITDLFYAWQNLASLGLSCDDVKGVISDRYSRIVQDLGLRFSLTAELAVISETISSGGSADYAASRGEYLNGKILAEVLDYDFVDPIDCIHFDSRGQYHEASSRLESTLRNRRAVIPGFYGSMPDGSIKTFSRGGSDLTGALVADAVDANLYENWTDVPGLLAADPRIVQDPRPIDIVTYQELRELAYMGANVFHEEAMFPLQRAGIRTVIKDTGNPNAPGTYIVPTRNTGNNVVLGIAGRRDFTIIALSKHLMNREVGFARRALSVLEKHQVNIEHIPSGIDTLSVIVETKQLEGKLDEIVQDIRNECAPDAIDIHHDIAMIATVGQGMVHVPGVAAQLFTAVAQARVNVRVIDQGSSELTILVGVKNDDYEKAIRAIYCAFIS